MRERQTKKRGNGVKGERGGGAKQTKQRARRKSERSVRRWDEENAGTERERESESGGDATEREKKGIVGVRADCRLGWCVSQVRDTRENGAVASLIRYVRSMRPFHHPLAT